MHEWSLAEAVISTALKVAKKEGLKEVTKLKIKIGELQQIDIATFKFALKETARGQSPILGKTKTKIETEKTNLKCRACGHKWLLGNMMRKLNMTESEALHFIPETAHAYLKCSKCGSPDFEILKGRGVWIDFIKGIK